MPPGTVLVLGAGLAGLAAARTLRDAGRTVVVLDKGRGPGGRLATRRLGRAVLDHGAQFFTVRDDALQRQTDDWMARGLVTEWTRGFGPEPDGHPRYVAVDGMAALAKDLARGLDVRTRHEVDAIIPTPDGYALTFVGGSADVVEGAAVVATAPVPQTLAVVRAGGLALDPDLVSGLERIAYHRVLALLVRLDGEPALAPPGAIQQPEDPTFTFIADNRAKGISPDPALTFHAAAALSSRLWDRSDRDVTEHLLAEAAPWFGEARPLEVQLKRWRHATPVEPWPERAVLAAQRSGPLVLAGDAFGGPKVEGAYRSGLAAAELLG